MIPHYRGHALHCHSHSNSKNCHQMLDDKDIHYRDPGSLSYLNIDAIHSASINDCSASFVNVCSHPDGPDMHLIQNSVLSLEKPLFYSSLGWASDPGDSFYNSMYQTVPVWELPSCTFNINVFFPA